MTDVNHYIEQLGRILPVRHRYVLTRRNTIRLRYKLFAGAAVVGLLFLSALPSRVAAITNILGDEPQSSRTVIDKRYVTAGLPYKSEAPDENVVASGVQFPESLTAVYQTPGADTQDRQKNKQNDKMQTASFNQHASHKTHKTYSKPVAKSRIEVIEIGSGDTLGAVLSKAGLSNAESYRLVESLKEHYDPRRIKPGQRLSVRYDPVDDIGSDYSLAGLDVEIDPVKSVKLRVTAPDIFDAEIVEKPTVTKHHAHSAEIELSLYGSGLKAGIPAAIISEAIRIYSWDVDFQRDIRRGDQMDVLYETIETEDGTPIKTGDILYARLNINGQDIPVYRYETNQGDVDYFTPDGQSIRKALMATPIDGARLSSGYGLRTHPVLGYQKMHKGVDFAAPRGTPIYAAGDGTIEKMKRWSSYGNYVRIRHNSSLKTAYAHLKGFKSGLSAGSRVKQGDVIGYVGSTGRSTGPHLHYEVLQNGKQVNPKTIDMPQGESLKGPDLARFKSHVKKLGKQYAALREGAREYAALDR